MYIKVNSLVVKYMHRMEVGCTNLLLQEAYTVCKSQQLLWYKGVKCILYSNGMGNIIEEMCLYTPNSITRMIKQRLNDQYVQLWNSKSDDFFNWDKKACPLCKSDSYNTLAEHLILECEKQKHVYSKLESSIMENMSNFNIMTPIDKR